MALSIKTLVTAVRAVSEDSKCVSMHVGCIVVRDGHIISTGYNGTNSGEPNCNEVHSERGINHTKWSEKHEIHAEMNAVLHSPTPVKGSIVIVTHSPCWNCVKHLKCAGVEGIYFLERYYQMTDEEFEECRLSCERAGIVYNQITESPKGMMEYHNDNKSNLCSGPAWTVRDEEGITLELSRRSGAVQGVHERRHHRNGSRDISVSTREIAGSTSCGCHDAGRSDR